jgi:hypothetical protein
MLEKRDVYKYLVGRPDGKHLEYLCVDGVFKKRDAKT